ncbi:MAG: gamma-glutamyl-gamma-aminobutyrate hydrolase family protein [Clostridiales bacterium]
MMKPVIGVVPSLQLLDARYSYTMRPNNAEAISDHGGLPLLLPYTEDESALSQILSLVDGIYFTGGCDILPSYFGEEPIQTLGSLCPPRDAFEIALYRLASAADMPMFGVCRGMQIMNIAAGGSIYQDLYAQLPKAGCHSQKDLPGEFAFHSIGLSPGCKMAQLLGAEKLAVNSFHHESVKDTAPGYRISAAAPDGVIEGMESQTLTYSLAVQWHPEYMYGKSPLFGRLYSSFVEAAAVYRDSKL